MSQKSRSSKAFNLAKYEALNEEELKKLLDEIPSKINNKRTYYKEQIQILNDRMQNYETSKNHLSNVIKHILNTRKTEQKKAS